VHESQKPPQEKNRVLLHIGRKAAEFGIYLSQQQTTLGTNDKKLSFAPRAEEIKYQYQVAG
jgi:hypothetical protein